MFANRIVSRVLSRARHSMRGTTIYLGWCSRITSSGALHLWSTALHSG